MRLILHLLGECAQAWKLEAKTVKIWVSDESFWAKFLAEERRGWIDWWKTFHCTTKKGAA
jgi:hypothetical protein